MTNSHPSQETFIIRLWSISPRKEGWRGQAQNVRTGQATVIHDLQDLLAFFEIYLPKKKEANPPAGSSSLR
jgi:hypothetical protein